MEDTSRIDLVVDVVVGLWRLDTSCREKMV